MKAQNSGATHCMLSSKRFTSNTSMSLTTYMMVCFVMEFGSRVSHPRWESQMAPNGIEVFGSYSWPLVGEMTSAMSTRTRYAPISCAELSQTMRPGVRISCARIP
eukprot:5878341-Amphidinium_carterae.1